VPRSAARTPPPQNSPYRSGPSCLQGHSADMWQPAPAWTIGRTAAPARTDTTLNDRPNPPPRPAPDRAGATNLAPADQRPNRPRPTPPPIPRTRHPLPTPHPPLSPASNAEPSPSSRTRPQRFPPPMPPGARAASQIRASRGARHRPHWRRGFAPAREVRRDPRVARPQAKSARAGWTRDRGPRRVLRRERHPRRAVRSETPSTGLRSCHTWHVASARPRHSRKD